MQSKLACSFRLIGLLIALAFACSLLPAFVGNAYALTDYCRNCGRYTSGYLDYNAPTGSIAAKHPTCTESGIAYFVCSECGTVDTSPTYVDPLGHDYVAGSSTATCTSGGEITYTCSRCGDSYSEHQDALGHDYVRSGTGPTCTEDGTYTYTCSRCGSSYTETIAALGHEYAHTVIAATCTTDGEETDTCSRCGDTKTAVLPALGHDWPKEWTVAKEATTTEEGLEYRVCTRCGEHEDRAIPKKLNMGLIGIIAALLVAAGGLFAAFKAGLFGVAAGAGATAGGWKLIRLTEKKIFVKLDGDALDKDFLTLLKSRPHLTLKLFDPESEATLSEQIEAVDPNAVILECTGEAGLDEMLETVSALRAEHPDIRYEAIVTDADEALEARIAEAEASGLLFAHVEAAESKYVKMSSLIVPLYKSVMKDADTLESVGIVADLFGIPAVGTVLSAIANADRAKELAGVAKDAFTGVDMDVSDGITVVNNIAEILGVDVVAATSELIEDARDTSDSVDDETKGTDEALKAGELGKDVASVLGTLLGA